MKTIHKVEHALEVIWHGIKSILHLILHIIIKH